MSFSHQFNTIMRITSLGIIYLTFLMIFASAGTAHSYGKDVIVLLVLVIPSAIIYAKKGVLPAILLTIVYVIFQDYLHTFSQNFLFYLIGATGTFVLVLVANSMFNQTQMSLKQEALTRENDMNGEFLELYNEIEAQRESANIRQQFLNTIINSLNPDMLLVLDGRGKIVFANSLFCSKFNIDEESIIGMTVFRLMKNIELSKEYLLNIDREAKKRGNYYFEHELTFKNGSTLSTETFVTWSEDLGIMVVLVRDIALRRELENELAHALEDSERKQMIFSTLFEAVQDALVVYDTDGEQFYHNTAGYRLIDASPQRGNIHSEHIQLCTLDGDVLPLESNPFIRILRGEESDPPTNYIINHTDGRQEIVLLDAFPLYYRKQPIGTAGTIRNVTNEYRDNLYNELLIELTHRCSELMEVNEIAQAAVDVLSEFLHISNILISIHNPDHSQFAKIIAMNVPPEQLSAGQIEAIRILEMTPIAPDAPAQSLRVIATGEPFVDFNPIQLENTTNQYEKYHQAAYMPLSAKGEILGCLNLGITSAGTAQWQIPNQGMLRAIANEIAMAIHRAMLYDNVRKMAFFDPLTGVHNHRALQNTLQFALEKAREEELPVSLVMLDVDHFRLFNESYGHDIGDTALKTVAASIQSSLRDVDFVARYGGEEFTVILPNIIGDAAMQIAERIRQSIELHGVEIGDDADPVRVTASLGLSTFPQHAGTPASLLKAADLALYESKHHGRNRVTAYDPSPAPEEQPVQVINEPGVLLEQQRAS